MGRCRNLRVPFILTLPSCFCAWLPWIPMSLVSTRVFLKILRPPVNFCKHLTLAPSIADGSRMLKVCLCLLPVVSPFSRHPAPACAHYPSTQLGRWVSSSCPGCTEVGRVLAGQGFRLFRNGWQAESKRREFLFRFPKVQGLGVLSSEFRT